MEKKSLSKKILSIVLNVLLYTFIGVCALVLILTVVSKRSESGGVEIFGYQLMTVSTESMEKCDGTDVSGYDIGSIPQNSLIFVQTKPTDPAELEAWYESIEEGDVLTFRYQYARQVTITHRVIGKIDNPSGGYTLTLQGDNKTDGTDLGVQIIDTSADPATATNYVIGKVTGQSYILGVLLTILSRPIGLVLCVILPCLIIMTLEIIRIVSVLGKGKKKKEQEEQAKKDAELEELRRRLAELEQQNAPAPEPTPADPLEDEQQPPEQG